jgi:hypothetical protein
MTLRSPHWRLRFFQISTWVRSPSFVSIPAPVGQALLGRQVGDVAQVRAAGTVREVEVLEVQ